MEKMVSVIVPIYNSENSIDKCVSSLINQSYKNLQIILINDGSNDNSLILLQEWEKKDSRIEVYTHSNKGVSYTRNQGLKYAKGEYIEFVDVDDYIELDTISKFVEAIELFDVDLIVCGYNFLSSNFQDCILLGENFKFQLKDIFFKFKELYDVGFFTSTWNKLYKRSLINYYFDEKSSFGEDFDFNLEYFSKCENIYYLNECLYNYQNYNSDSLSKKYKIDDYAFLLRIRNKIINFTSFKGYILNNSFDEVFMQTTLSYCNNLIEYKDIKKLISLIIDNDLNINVIINSSYKNRIYCFLLNRNMPFFIWCFNSFLQLRRRMFCE